MNSSSKNLISYVTGVITGAVLGILYAPDKGEVTRDKLSYRLSEYRDQLETTIRDLVKKGDEVAADIANGGNSTAKMESQKVVNEARQKAERLLEDVDALMNQIKAKA